MTNGTACCLWWLLNFRIFLAGFGICTAWAPFTKIQFSLWFERTLSLEKHWRHRMQKCFLWWDLVWLYMNLEILSFGWTWCRLQRRHAFRTTFWSHFFKPLYNIVKRYLFKCFWFFIFDPLRKTSFGWTWCCLQRNHFFSNHFWSHFFKPLSNIVKRYLFKCFWFFIFDPLRKWLLCIASLALFVFTLNSNIRFQLRTPGCLSSLCRSAKVLNERTCIFIIIEAYLPKSFSNLADSRAFDPFRFPLNVDEISVSSENINYKSFCPAMLAELDLLTSFLNSSY